MSKLRRSRFRLHVFNSVKWNRKLQYKRVIFWLIGSAILHISWHSGAFEVFFPEWRWLLSHYNREFISLRDNTRVLYQYCIHLVCLAAGCYQTLLSNMKQPYVNGVSDQCPLTMNRTKSNNSINKPPKTFEILLPKVSETPIEFLPEIQIHNIGSRAIIVWIEPNV